ncbi:tRNA glutamyl-Q(34) synthetase GluQRS [Xanthobacter autotrophicus]|uniref:tRNA glutamyl-Q(34) synthetase GluQRS n=1 Tax=Xanthobacter autotrophicus TaxID=280 RepID=UPI0024A72A7D|nr:tRNA glutamyl-Q(34) synthetase GluQRS [Xanthobacter autotrophicus]MDI4657360.1 tRNA glutamyl-Q(34) synthetase GluQRS [Xanthobacter autotrophicus]
MALPASPFTCRFAPSPNGRLHLGHAFSALVNVEAARRMGGIFLVRLEDIDTTRCRPEYARGILDDLAWLGIFPDAPVRRQSAHFADYAAAIARLEALGLVYPAFESRADIARAVIGLESATGRPAPRDPDGAPLVPFPRSAMSDVARATLRDRGAPFVVRLDMAASIAAVREMAGEPLQWEEAQGVPEGPRKAVEADAARWGDVVLARKDVPTSYHLSVVVDDAAQGITHVIRGMDLYHATSVHVLLQRLLGLPTPAYHHHRLVLDESGYKLSKSNSATSLAALRAAGATPQDVLRRLELAAGTRDEPAYPTPST